MKNNLVYLLYLIGRRERWIVLLLFIMMVAGALFEVAGIGSIPVFLAFLNDSESMPDRKVIRHLYELTGADTPRVFLTGAAIGLVILFLLKNSYLSLLAWVNARFAARLQVSLISRLFEAYMRAPYTFHLEHNTAGLLQKIQYEANQVVLFVVVPFLGLCMETLMVLLIFDLLFFVQPVASFLAVMVLGGTSVLLLLFVRRRVQYFGQQMHDSGGEAIQHLREGLGSLKEARILGRESFFIRSVVESSSAYAEATGFHRFYSGLPQRFIETIAVLGMLLIAVLLLAGGSGSPTYVPVLVLFALAAIRLLPSFRHIVEAVVNIRFYGSSLKAVYEDLIQLENRPLSRAPASFTERIPFRDAIELRDLRFTYPGSSTPALERITLTIPRGAAVAFVGASGAGKTTLAHVLLGLIPPSTGSIRVDGIDIGNNISGWQRNIGFIPQTLYLSDDTIRQNIAFGIDPDNIDNDRIEAVVQVAQLETFVASLPEGLDTRVGDDGIRLSGGQRQRIAIARALYHDPPVLIMDEATSALDNETERFVIRAIERLRGNRTLIVIAHRLSTVRRCDTLYLLKNGHLLASGSYDELLESSAEFKAIALA